MSFKELPVSPGLAFNNRTPDSHWGKPEVVDALVRIGKLWGTDRPAISIGHISRKNGGKFPPHNTHKNGDDVDIRPMRKDGKNASVTWRDAQYSQSLTREMIEVIRDNAPIKSILFNDPILIGERLCQAYPNHSNHLHVNFTVIPKMYPLLKFGSKGQEVRVLQEKLQIPVDGIFGQKTFDALKRFQKRQGLVEDGIAGPKVWAALDLK